MKIENTFLETDTLSERVEKLNQQLGLELDLRPWPHLNGVACFGLMDGAIFYTGPMSEDELLHWTATYAAGYRLRAAHEAHAEAGLSLFRQLVGGENALRELNVFWCNVAEHEHGCKCFWEQCEQWAAQDYGAETDAGFDQFLRSDPDVQKVLKEKAAAAAVESGEGPTGCMDDGDELSLAMRGMSQQDLNKVLDETLHKKD